MCSYLSRDENECSKAVKQVLKEAIGNGATYYEQMKSMTYSSASKQECFLQKAVYHILPEQWLRKTSQESCEC